LNPDEAAARGAALYADYLLAKASGDRRTAFEITSVPAHGLVGVTEIPWPTVVDPPPAAGLCHEAVARWKSLLAAGPGLDAFASLDQQPRGNPAEAAAEEEAGAAAEQTEPAIALAEEPEHDAETPPPDPMQFLAVDELAELAGIVSASPARQWPRTDSSVQAGVSRWLRVLIGYVTSAVVGLGLGYLLLSWLRPANFPLPWR
jgi:hypothetical protein